ncbi:hypothetical protein N0V82_005600 [Gnomoniopsis sp. IMI 355080]|nr:hypothetical protein N0V82_005600 [Gnomoniopsis sp. IMI 355080]
MKRVPSWPEWLSEFPTSPARIQTVYDACVQSRIFAPPAQRPIVLRKVERGPVFASDSIGMSQKVVGASEKVDRWDTVVVERTFRRTPGLQDRDWEARGINFHHAVRIARQLQLTDYFSKKKKKLSQLFGIWSEVQAQASARDEKSAGSWDYEQRKVEIKNYKWPSQPCTTRQTSGTNTQADQAHPIPREGNDAENAERARAERSRRLLKRRKQLEQASDAAEGIKSKRRPLRLAATSEGVPLTFETMKKLRRVERRGREIVVDKEVRQRTKAASGDLAPQKTDQPRRKAGTKKGALQQGDHDSWKERRPERKRGSRATPRVKISSKKPS